VQNINEDSDQFSTELRFASAPADTGGFEYIAGLYYLTVDTDRLEFNDFYTGLINPFAPGTPRIDTRIAWDQTNATDSTAIFAELKYQISDKTALRLGGRYSNEDKDFTMTTTCGNPAGVLFTRGPNIPVAPFVTGGPGLAGTCLANVAVEPFQQATYDAVASESWSRFTGKVGLEYTPTDGQLWYLTFNQGFKSGGFPPSGTTQAIAETPFNEELADNIELGGKSTWADGRVRLNFAVFYTDYQDLQVGVLDPISGALTIQNAADATSQGLEVDFAYSPNEHFQLFAGYAYVDATYDNFISSGVDVSGAPLRGPENSGYLRGRFETQFGSGALAFLAEVNYKDEFYQFPIDVRGLFPSRTLVNVRASYLTADEKLEFSIWGRNITDEEAVLQAVPPPGGLSSRLYGPPATYGVTVSWNY
jgi:iron complex outermembrane receptor protein